VKGKQPVAFGQVCSIPLEDHRALTFDGCVSYMKLAQPRRPRVPFGRSG
jgi:hypothetical protein